MAIIQIIVEINDKFQLNSTLLLTNEKYTAFRSFLFGKRLKSQTVRTELYLIYDCFSLNFLFFSSKTTFEWNVVVVYQSARPEETDEVV